jgi:hypothetical protein
MDCAIFFFCIIFMLLLFWIGAGIWEIVERMDKEKKD